MLKTVDELLTEALDKIAAKSVDAAKRIYESALSAEEKLASAQQILEGVKTPKHAWMKESKDAASKLAVEIRESFYELRPTTKKNNGVLDNLPLRESAGDDNQTNLVFEAARRMGMTEREARIFADMDDDGEKITAAILKA
jgi:hypothetical protein